MPAPRTPAKDKCAPFIAQAIAERWTIGQLCEAAGVGRSTASLVLQEASEAVTQQLDAKMGVDATEAVRVARKVRDKQIGQAKRIDALIEKGISDLEAAAAAGELSLRDLETLGKLREKHWLHLKDLSGISLAEKLKLASAKGEATGKGFAGALIDATDLDIGDGIFECETEELPG